ncbi:MAG: alpha,alpha-trehalase TreF [Ginsengibacter sp.]
MINDIFSLGELFERVQMEKIFPDGKTFVDATPKRALDDISNSYQQQKNDKHFNLNSFIEKYFELPKEEKEIVSNKLPILEHINTLWDKLTHEPKISKNSLISLPNKYIIPGGRFREIYYWDSYFTMLGLQVSGKIEIIRSMVENFAWLIDTIGHIPNGNRTYYLGRSQPPFFASMVKLLAEIEGMQILQKFLPQLKKEHDFWMSEGNKRVSKMPDGTTLNHYSDNFSTPRPESFREDVEIAKNSVDSEVTYKNLRAGAESGWDFSSRWFNDGINISTIHTIEIIPVDLNCLLYDLEITLSKGYDLNGDKTNADIFLIIANERKQAIHTYLWNNDIKCFMDYDVAKAKSTLSLSLAACFPLFFNLATTKQAIEIAQLIKEKFLKYGGVVTTLKNTGQQWDAPNGWAPLQWTTIKGLLNYNFNDLAETIALRWLTLNDKVYANTGKMMEKYNVIDDGLLAGGGEYPAQDGFGWTNGVYLKLDRLFRQSKS